MPAPVRNRAPSTGARVHPRAGGLGSSDRGAPLHPALGSRLRSHHPLLAAEVSFAMFQAGISAKGASGAVSQVEDTLFSLKGDSAAGPGRWDLLGEEARCGRGSGRGQKGASSQFLLPLPPPASPDIQPSCRGSQPGALLELTEGLHPPHPRSSLPSSEHQFCGGRLEKAQGTLTTPNWPESDYPPGISCSWHIIAPRDQVIALTFEKFDLEPDTYCRYDSVSVFNGAVSDDARRLGKFCGDAVPGSISSEGNELLVQFVSDLSVTADGFSASYKTLPRGAAKEGPGPSPKPGTEPKVKPPLKPQPPEKTPIAPDAPTVTCPKQCRRTGTLQSNFCASSLVVTATVKSMVRGPGEGLTVTVSLIGAYKTGGLDLPSPPTGASLKFYVPCKQCPPMKKGASYLLMGQVEENRGPVLPPESFVVLHRPNQDQILTNLSKRKCLSQPVQAAESQA
ncbi:hypothetical protein P7K49_004100 [Saguinus oedipus]|uniref:Procollagen C-endopeptidase enhancer 1 n=1 Tax=Saguinus oedipus TaxID=9490 RepID=A0ABQ9W6D7_SAGOE|nr:hypothetical protein P7K49_004100 [Saguinus oedipus]